MGETVITALLIVAALLLCAILYFCVAILHGVLKLLGGQNQERDWAQKSDVDNRDVDAWGNKD